MSTPPSGTGPEDPRAPDDSTTPAAASETPPPAPEPEQTPGRWLLGCLGKTLLVFVVVALLVFGACFMMLSSM